jgi:hypothetical protein
LNKKYLAISLGISTSMFTMTSEAALSSSALLAFDAGIPVYDLVDGYLIGIHEGSYFSVDTNDDGFFMPNESIPLSPGTDGGLLIGQSQVATIPTGLTGTVISPFDAPWQFFGDYGAHQSNSPMNILADDGNGNVLLDFSGWGVTWNGIPNINLGGDVANFPTENGMASLICGQDCSAGDSFVLDYLAHVPLNDPTGFGGVPLKLHLEGTVSAVPVPAAMWLFGSGLIGLISVARRRVH